MNTTFPPSTVSETYEDDAPKSPGFKPYEIPNVRKVESLDTSAHTEIQKPRAYIGMDYENLNSHASTAIISDLIALAGGDTSSQFRVCVCSPQAAEIAGLVRGTNLARVLDFQNGMFENCATWIRYFTNKPPKVPAGLKPTVLEDKKVGPSTAKPARLFSPYKGQPSVDRVVNERPLPYGNNPNTMPSPSRVVNPYAPAIQLFSSPKGKLNE